MRTEVDLSALKQTRWQQLLVRFCLGGAITAATGIIAKKYGPGVGGLFLAFPAIFPAGATLIEKHEREKKRKAGLDGRRRARKAAAVDAAGAAIGSIGLLAFALLISRFVTRYKPWIVVLGGTLCWAGCVFLWRLRKHRWHAKNVAHEPSVPPRRPFC